MIGLGSNRMSVCRRGGMSVTQAGKGGMEWLAGGRLPSWASPYSAQATAALKDAYPQYWSEIQQYGFDNPYVVPFVNANPIGWGGYIAYCYQLDSVQVGDGHIIDTGVPASSNICSLLDITLDGNINWILWGASSPRYGVLNNSGYRDLRFHFGSYNNENVMSKLVGRHQVKVDNGKLYVDDVLRATANVSFTTSTHLTICTNSGGVSINYLHSGKIWDGTTGDVLRDLLPAKLKSNNTEGAWDLVSATFLPSTN